MAPERLTSSALAVSETDLLEPIRDVSHTVIQLLAPHVAAAGLDPHTFWPLHHLDRGQIRHPGELARRLGISPATCTGSVDRLVEQGYVVRRPSEGDRRQVVLAVTAKGHRTLESVWRRFDRSLREVLVGIPPTKIAITAETLRAIAAQLRTRGAPLSKGARP
jgi:DNA-binding MarR family transcriptional regulator